MLACFGCKAFIINILMKSLVASFGFIKLRPHLAWFLQHIEKTSLTCIKDKILSNEKFLIKGFIFKIDFKDFIQIAKKSIKRILKSY